MSQGPYTLTPKSQPQNDWDLKQLIAYVRELGNNRLRYGVLTSFNPGKVPANSTLDTALTKAANADIDTFRAGMFIAVTPPSTLNAGLIPYAFVGTDKTLTIRITNTTAGDLTPVAGNWAYYGFMVA